jgi:transposase
MVRTFAKRYAVAVPCVVGDAAMISKGNVTQLTNDGYSYIVGARLANVSRTLLTQIAKLSKVDHATLRLSTEQGDLVVGFSAVRFRKDSHELQKQLERAALLVKKGEPGKRARFVHKMNETYTIDEALKTKATQLLGIKGYYTNLKETDVSNTEVISRYHDLWHVEAAFRMSKHDLATRPIFHHAEDAVRAHVLICFVALVLGTYAEQKTGQSLRSLMDSLWDVVDARVVDTLTKEERMLRTEVGSGTAATLKKLGVSY